MLGTTGTIARRPVVLVLHVDLFGGPVHSPYLYSMVRSLADFEFAVLTGQPSSRIRLDAWPPNVRFLWRRGGWLDQAGAKMPPHLARIWGIAAESVRAFQNRRLVRGATFDLLHIHAAVEVESLLRAGSRLRNRAFWIIARWFSDFRWTHKPVLFTEHSQFSRRGELGFANPLHEGDLVVAEAFPNVICVDRDAFRYLTAHDEKVGFSRRRWFVPNGIDTGLFYPRPLEDRPTLKIGYAGRIFRTGESRTFLPAVADSLPDDVELHLAVATSMEETAIRRRWFPGGHVSIVRNVPNSEMPSFYWSVDLLVNPLVWGGIGRSTLEAMSCGRPAAMFSNADRYPLTDENGFLIPLEDTGAFLTLIDRLRKTRDELSRKGRLSRVRIEQEFGEREVSEAMREVYRDLLPSKPREGTVDRS